MSVLGNENSSLIGGAAGALLDARHTPFAEELLCGGKIAVGLSQGLLAIHHTRAGLFAQGFHIRSFDFHDFSPRNCSIFLIKAIFVDDRSFDIGSFLRLLFGLHRASSITLDIDFDLVLFGLGGD